MASHLAKQSRPSRSLKEFYFPSLPDNPTLCSVNTLQEYILRTKQFREGKDDDHKDRLFITTTGGHSPVRSATIAKWIKSALTKAGVDTSIFKAHSFSERSNNYSSSTGWYINTKDPGSRGLVITIRF